MKCYYDGSLGDDASGDSWITLGGVAATDSAWAEFDLKWNRMLKERYPVAPYIHMIDVMGHDDPFDYGWDRQKKRQLISDAIVVLSQMDKLEFRWFRCSINQTAMIGFRISENMCLRIPQTSRFDTRRIDGYSVLEKLSKGRR